VKRYEALDGLRGIAAVAVVLFHIRWPNHVTHFNAITHAYLFVDLFFVLSGFVLAAAYSTTITSMSELRRFFVLRFFRIYPLHAAALALLVAMETIKLAGSNVGIAAGHPAFSGANSLQSLTPNILLVQGLGVLDRLSWNTPSWSISCEAAAYILFGFAALYRALDSRLFLMLALPVSVVLAALVVQAKGDLNATYDWGLARCVAGFYAGAFIAWLVRNPRISPIFDRMGAQTATMATTACVAWIIAALSIADGHLDVLVLPGLVLLIVFLHRDSGLVANVLRTRPFADLGRISYSIYLLHVPVLLVLLTVIRRSSGASLDSPSAEGVPILSIEPWTGDLLVICAIVEVIAIATISYRIIETRGRNLGRRIANRLDRTT
jgi:peptidoglycan/LPS O-acetylase OafA/YrhL